MTNAPRPLPHQRWGSGGVPSCPTSRLQGMNREERRRILGDDVIAQIRARVREAPEPSDELVAELRRIMTNPAGSVPRRRKGGQSD